MTPIAVECTGVRILRDEIACEVGGERWRFVIAPDRKRGVRFQFGLFVNEAAYSDQVLCYPRERRVCALFESPISRCYRDVDALVHHFPVIFTHQRSLLDRAGPFRPLFFGTNWLGVYGQEDVRRILDTRLHKSAIVSFIGNITHPVVDAYRLRREVAEYVLSRGDVDCYGKGIRQTPGKREALARYRFSIAMENAARDHYFSEKLVDCLLLETVPIYYGCPGIGELLDTRGLMTFQTLEELQAILQRLSPELYEEMRPYAAGNRRTIVERGWDSHVSLFARLAECLARECSLPPDTARASTSQWDRMRRWVSGSAPRAKTSGPS